MTLLRRVTKAWEQDPWGRKAWDLLTGALPESLYENWIAEALPFKRAKERRAKDIYYAEQYDARKRRMK